jgi:methionyl-tRNA formyltransferase
MNAAGLRVVFVSQYASALRGMVRVCRSKGYEPVAAVCTRAEHPRKGVGSPRMKTLAKAIVGACPSGMGVSVVDSMADLADLVERYAPDLLLVRGFPWRLPPRVLDVAGYGSVNLHPSALPEFRGPFPVHQAIRRGDALLGVTAHRMDPGFDTGPILSTARFEVPGDESGPAIWSRVDRGAEEALSLALDRVAARDPGRTQTDADATYAGPLGPDDGVLDWSRPAEELHNLVRAWSLGSLGPPGTEGPTADLDGVPVRVLKTSLTAVDGPGVRCGDGRIWLAHFEKLSRSDIPGGDHERSG